MVAGEWHLMVQAVVEEIDRCIKNHEDEKATLTALSKKLGFSEFYVSRKFREISGMSFREYLRQRSLAFAFKDVRDTKKGFLEIAWSTDFRATRRSRVRSRNLTAQRQANSARIRVRWCFGPSSALSTVFLSRLEDSK